MPDRPKLSNTGGRGNRLRAFASFFKGYMGVMSLVTAAVAPILTAVKALPIYEVHKAPLAAFSGVLCFLLLAWVFYARLTLRRFMAKGFLADVAPLLLIGLCVVSFILYFVVLEDSVARVRATSEFQNATRPAESATAPDPTDREHILQTWGNEYPIPRNSTLIATYIGVFAFAELAFLLMALKEYSRGGSSNC